MDSIFRNILHKDWPTEQIDCNDLGKKWKCSKKSPICQIRVNRGSWVRFSRFGRDTSNRYGCATFFFSLFDVKYESSFLTPYAQTGVSRGSNLTSNLTFSTKTGSETCLICTILASDVHFVYYSFLLGHYSWNVQWDENIEKSAFLCFRLHFLIWQGGSSGRNA